MESGAKQGGHKNNGLQVWRMRNRVGGLEKKKQIKSWVILILK